MKTVYCEILDKNRGQFKIRFWTKEDKSNALTCHSPTTHTAHIKEAIEREIGLKNFELVFVKKY